MYEETNPIKTQNTSQSPSTKEYIPLKKNKTKSSSKNFSLEDQEEVDLEHEPTPPDKYLITFQKDQIIKEYASNTKYIITNSFIAIAVSIIIFSKSLLGMKIIKHSRNILFCIIFSSISFFTNIANINIIYDDFLRHLIRYKLARHIGFLNSVLHFYLFWLEIYNIIFVFSKISELKKTCEKNDENQCEDAFIYNCIIGLSGFSFVGMLILFKFLVCYCIECFLIIIGYKKDMIEREFESTAPIYKTANIDLDDFEIK